ncbi:MAG: tetratricopeptide repeat protein [Leptolyngbya sp.]|nr:tetratricopeptide repeat protein [Leptolyngbya sp.]
MSLVHNSYWSSGSVSVINKRNRWLVNTILVIAVLAFVGFSVVPIVSAWLANRETSLANNSPSTENSSTEVSPDQEADLKAQVKGYQLVLEREPNNQTALLGLLQAQLQLNDIAGAIPPLESLARLNPDDTRYAILLGQAKQQTGDTEGAAQTYRSILSTQPGNMDALRGLVALLVEEARPEAAIGLLQDTLTTANDVNQIQANSVDVTAVQLLLGELYVELGRDAEALAIYDESIKNSAEDFRPLLSKALLLQAQGNQEEAEPLFTNAAALAPAQYKDEINRLATASSTPGEEVGDGTSDGTTRESATEAPENMDSETLDSDDSTIDGDSPASSTESSADTPENRDSLDETGDEAGE